MPASHQNHPDPRTASLMLHRLPAHRLPRNDAGWVTLGVAGLLALQNEQFRISFGPSGFGFN
jgi:hypothetical protein